ncbi:hypothetical protein E2K80_16375 [Rhodophyticola sp. CCM32]|uniref:hypothetical protein n=1 Tax=Rhodophyticola sp. CCM32 TaxID=2916397 RepID=UPI00107F6A83|nr:hypothetical protein [Rhodophyticola sp. CCM32]QBY02117.1 hypothetical protein E2K80_16375 [Rhodophyticola sp. CCM32]
MQGELAFTVTYYLLPGAVLYLAVTLPADKRIWLSLAGAALAISGWYIYQTLFDQPSRVHVDLGPGFRMMTYITLFSSALIGLTMQATGKAKWLRSIHWSCLPISAIPATVISLALGAGFSFLAGSL